MAAAPYADTPRTDARRGSEALHEEALAEAFARIADDICIDGTPQSARPLTPPGVRPGTPAETFASASVPGCGTPLEDILAADRLPGGAFLPSSPLLRKVTAAEALQGAGFPAAVLVPASPCSVAERLATLAPLRTPPPVQPFHSPHGDYLAASGRVSPPAQAYTPPPSQRPFVFTPPPTAALATKTFDYGQTGDFAPRIHAPPGGDYVCKLCAIPGHWLKDCPLYEPRGPTVGAPRSSARGTPGRPAVPPPNYVCRLCGIAGHWIEQCSRFQQRPHHTPHMALMPGQVLPQVVPAGPPPRGYVCNLCHQPGHWIQQCAEFVAPRRF